MRGYLKIILWIPVRVVYNDCVSSCQVDAKTPCPGTQQEDKTVRLGLGEPINGFLSQLTTDSSI